MTKEEMKEGAFWSVVGEVISAKTQPARSGNTNGRDWTFPERDVIGVAFRGGTEYVEIEKPHQQVIPEVGSSVCVSGTFRTSRGRTYLNDPQVVAL